MAVKWVLTQGIGFSPGSTRYIPALGFLAEVAAPPAAGGGAPSGAGTGRRTTGIRRTTRSFSYVGGGGLRIGGAAETSFTPHPQEFAFASQGMVRLTAMAQIEFYDHGPFLRNLRDEEELILIGVL